MPASNSTLCSGFTPSNQYRGRFAKSRAQSALYTRTLVICFCSARKKINAYGKGSGEQFEYVPLNELPFSDSIRQPMQHLFAAASKLLSESKQHIVRSLAAVGIRYPIQSGAVCFCTRPSTAALRPAAAESSCNLAFEIFGLGAASCAAAIAAHTAINIAIAFLCQSFTACSFTC